MATVATVRKLALKLPGVEESTSYGTVAFKVTGKLFVRVLDDDALIATRIDRALRPALIASAPKIFSLTPHYENYPWVLVRLAQISPAKLGGVLEASWR